MQTPTDSSAPAPNWLDPFGSWEAAKRWNAIASEWMTRGWQQWLELMTAWPALEAPATLATAKAAVPLQAGTQDARNAHAIRAQAAGSRTGSHEGKRAERPTARATKRAAPKRSARPQATARSARSRG